jgi:hypothetical protein
VAQETGKRGMDEGSQKVKALAEEQKVSIKLTAQQMEAIAQQWTKVDSSKPAKITFHVEGSDRAVLTVAAYTYVDTTCCAKLP